MLKKRKVAIAVALGALGGIAFGAAPASADRPQQFACYATDPDFGLSLLDTSPGDPGWAADVQLCQLVKGFPTRVGPYFGP